jgi:hypothetical protein
MHKNRGFTIGSDSVTADNSLALQIAMRAGLSLQLGAAPYQIHMTTRRWVWSTQATTMSLPITLARLTWTNHAQMSRRCPICRCVSKPKGPVCLTGMPHYLETTVLSAVLKRSVDGNDSDFHDLPKKHVRALIAPDTGTVSSKTQESNVINCFNSVCEATKNPIIVGFCNKTHEDKSHRETLEITSYRV